MEFNVPNIDPAAAQQNALKTAMMGTQNKTAQLQNQLVSQQMADEREMRPMKNAAEAVAYLTEISPMITPDNYEQSRQWLIQRNGFNPELLPPLDQIMAGAPPDVPPQEYFEAWKRQGLTTLSAQVKQSMAEAQMMNALKPKEQTVSDLGKLIAERDQLPAGDPRRKIYDDRIEKLNAKSGGRTIRSLPGGGFEYIEGTDIPNAGIMAPTEGMQKPTAKDLESEILDTDKMIVRLDNILANFDRDFLTYQGKAKAIGLNLADKANVKLSAENKKWLRENSVFMQNSIENINLYIKEITGAQMSEAEANRLRKAVADAGDSVLSGDGPTKFLSKVRNAVKKAKIAKLRAAELRTKGLEWSLMDDKAKRKAELIYSDDDLVDSRGDELRDSGLSEKDVVNQLRQEGLL